MLTFDDGYYNNYYYALPLLEKYNCKAVISPIASVSEKFTETKDISVTYGHITFDDIKEMSDSGYVEIQNHSYDMHSLKSRKRGRVTKHINLFLRKMLSKLKACLKMQQAKNRPALYIRSVQKMT